MLVYSNAHPHTIWLSLQFKRYNVIEAWNLNVSVDNINIDNEIDPRIPVVIRENECK